MSFAAETYLRSLMAMPRAEIGERMKAAERQQGFEIVGEAAWLDRAEWTDFTILSTDGHRVRLVALEAKQPGKGAFTRLIGKITRARLTPVLVEPNQSLIDWCKRHDWRSRQIKGSYPHEIWYPRHQGRA